jgi:DNA repair protein RadA/Sms
VISGMAAKKNKVTYGCSECGATFAKWAGRCHVCGAMNSITELNRFEAASTAEVVAAKQAAATVRLESVQDDGTAAPEPPRLLTGEAELDRVLGGGLPAGAAVLVGGEPGIGKSTLLAQAAGGLARSLSGQTKEIAKKIAYVTGEESTSQVRARLHRLQHGDAQQLQLAATENAQAIAGLLASGDFAAVVVDSIQVISDPDLDGVAGTPSQVRAVTSRLVSAAKASNTALILIGHVTKDGSLAGPRTLEHLVDTVLNFEGDRYQDLRSLRAVKNRFGSTAEVGLFSMTGTGLQAVADPAGVFISGRAHGVPGSVICPIVDGSRCLMVEVQALVNPTEAPQPSRRVAGCDHNRVAMILAVLSRRLRMPLGNCDVFINITGGIRVSEPAADLAIALAVAGAWREEAVPADLAAIGEVGLGGELRSAGRYELRTAEARRLGFRRLLGPGPGKGAGRIKVDSLAAALDAAYAAGR